MDILTLDAEQLRKTADIISVYTLKQREVMLNYMNKIMDLSSGWKDDETFSELFIAVSNVHSKVVSVMEEVNNSADYFRDKAEQIENRPMFGESSFSSSSQTSSVKATFSSSPAASKTTGRFYSSVEKIMSKTTLNNSSLNDEMCELDRVGKVNDYVKISSNGRRIDDLEYVGTFLSPANGEKIYCKTIAWRCTGIGEANAQNVCGADFYYVDGTFCGSYVGKNWQDIYENNYCDTRNFRK